MPIVLCASGAAGQDPPAPAPDADFEIRPGYVLVDDMVLPREVAVERMPYQTNFWYRHVVPYVFDANVTSLNQTRALDAMAAIEAEANIKFIPRTSQTDYIRFRNSTGNNSYVGEIGGAQTVNIVSWTWKYIIVHELLHALGCWHTQQRSDRDNFVTIRYENAQAGTEGNFDTAWWADVYGTYDFASVMHYDACSFSICCPAGSTCGCTGSECWTIEAKPAYAAYQNQMGNRTDLSAGDRQWLVFAYGHRDCNANGVHDYYDVLNGTSEDCNLNDMPDECDCELGTPSAIDQINYWYQLPYTDCNSNGIPDACDLSSGLVTDCNADEIADICQDGFCYADIDYSCTTDVLDFNILALHFSQLVEPNTKGDLNGDGKVNTGDFNILASNFGCEF